MECLRELNSLKKDTLGDVFIKYLPPIKSLNSKQISKELDK